MSLTLEKSVFISIFLFISYFKVLFDFLSSLVSDIISKYDLTKLNASSNLYLSIKNCGLSKLIPGYTSESGYSKASIMLYSYSRIRS